MTKLFKDIIKSNGWDVSDTDIKSHSRVAVFSSDIYNVEVKILYNGTDENLTEKMIEFAKDENGEKYINTGKRTGADALGMFQTEFKEMSEEVYDVASKLYDSVSDDRDKTFKNNNFPEKVRLKYSGGELIPYI